MQAVVVRDGPGEAEPAERAPHVLDEVRLRGGQPVDEAAPRSRAGGSRAGTGETARCGPAARVSGRQRRRRRCGRRSSQPPDGAVGVGVQEAVTAAQVLCEGGVVVEPPERALQEDEVRDAAAAQIARDARPPPGRFGGSRSASDADRGTGRRAVWLRRSSVGSHLVTVATCPSRGVSRRTCRAARITVRSYNGSVAACACRRSPTRLSPEPYAELPVDPLRRPEGAVVVASESCDEEFERRPDPAARGASRSARRIAAVASRRRPAVCSSPARLIAFAASDSRAIRSASRRLGMRRRSCCSRLRVTAEVGAEPLDRPRAPAG